MKHRIYSTPLPDGTNRYWWTFCAHCQSREFWESWELAVWYLQLHLRFQHDSV
jgi:hypothetical protein